MRAIAAMDANRVIGHKGRIPWYLPDDFKWFKKATLGSTMLMGRATYDSIGKPLPFRTTCVLTSEAKQTSVAVAPGRYNVSIDWVMQNYQRRDVWLCGGAKVYQRFLPLCTEVFMTHVMGEYEGDTYMPPFEDEFPNQEIVLEHRDFWVVKYTR